MDDGGTGIATMCQTDGQTVKEERARERQRERKRESEI